MNESNWKFIEKLPKVDQAKIHEILDLKKKYDVTILAHNYQYEPIQLIADVLGDSLALAQAGMKSTSKYILFAGVSFMAETAAILNPQKIVIFPEKSSICSMASYATLPILKEYRKTHPGIPVVMYINSTAEAKSQADIICTSSNAIKIVNSIVKEFKAPKFAFSPDKNLGAYISRKTGIPVDIVPPEGNCWLHHMYTLNDVDLSRKKLPGAKLLIHPEAPWEVAEKGDFIGSTSQIINYVKEHPNEKRYIIGTEQGVTDLLRREYPTNEIIPLNDKAVCKSMKKITLDSLLNAIRDPDNKKNIIKVKKEISDACINAIDKMMKIS
jgi:quinolinate synthase